MSIYIVIGTRAQLIKMAPLMIELNNQNIRYQFIYTGQHKDTINELINHFGIKKPNVNLSVEGSEAKNLKLMLKWLIRMIWILVKNPHLYIRGKGNLVIVHGDTFSTVWGALLGRITHSRVVHIESGLRSFNILEPFPEELNRLVTFQLADIYACQGEWAINNLKKNKGLKLNTKANTIYDTLNWALNTPDASNPTEKNYAVISIHRFENLYNKKRLEILMRVIRILSKKMKVLFVQHPVTQERLKKYGYYIELSNEPNVILKQRMNYTDFMKLLRGADLVISDGGSNQEELSYLGVPTLLLRKNTERPEGIGRNVILSGLIEDKMISFINNYEKWRYPPLSLDVSPSKIIVNKIKEIIH